MPPNWSYDEVERLSTLIHDIGVNIQVASAQLLSLRPAEALHEIDKLHARLHREDETCDRSSA